MIPPRFRRHSDLLLGLLLFVLPAVFYPLAATRQGVFYVGDIFRLYYPTRAVYASAIRHADLPLWAPDILAGFPLFAEGQIGALYPLNIILYAGLPVDLALNYSILLSVGLAGVAMYGLARVLRMRPGPALLAAIVFAYSGFFVGHFNHLNILAAAAWLPVQLTLSEVVMSSRPSKVDGRKGLPMNTLAAIGLAFAVGIQFLAGHPQIWLMSVLMLVIFASARAIWPPGGGRLRMAAAVSRLLPVLLAVATGTLLAAVQLLPTWELVRYSVRAGGLPGDYLTSFSWHPALLATLVVPYALGNPYPNVSVELAAYLGLLPLYLAATAAVTYRHSRLTRLLVTMAVAALLLAFGDYTPVFPLVGRLPVINFFRVPARFLYPFTTAVALLAGQGLEIWLSRTERACLARAGCRKTALWIASGGLFVGATVVIRLASLEALLAARWLAPAALLVVTAAVVALARQGRVASNTFLVVAIGLVLVDLYAFAAVFRLTYNDLMPLDDFYATPASVKFLPANSSDYRTLTSEAIVPALSVMRASLYPDIGLLYRRPSANGYFPLVPRQHARYLADVTAGRLNLLNARYFLIPQLLAVSPAAEDYDLHNPFVPDPVGHRLEIPPTPAEQIKIVSFTSQSADWSQGELAATIVLTGTHGATARLPLRVGQETAEWAYDREDVAPTVAHRQPPVAETWPARSGFPPIEHAGHAYRAVLPLPAPMVVEAVEVQPAKPEGLIHVSEFVLVGHDVRRNLATLLSLGHHRLAYRDQDVVIYENQDVLPRAYVVPQARELENVGATLAVVDGVDWDPRREVLLESTSVNDPTGPRPIAANAATRSTAPGSARITHYASRRVVVEAEALGAGYLVLLDSYYPGWHGTVDGVPVAIQRANLLFRAVRLDAGQHTVVFEYAPTSFKLGAAVSVLTLMVLIGLVITTVIQAWPITAAGLDAN